jgi:hypothetical protein
MRCAGESGAWRTGECVEPVELPLVLSDRDRAGAGGLFKQKWCSMTVRGRIMEAANRTGLILELKDMDWIGLLYQKLTRTTPERLQLCRDVASVTYSLHMVSSSASEAAGGSKGCR